VGRLSVSSGGLNPQPPPDKSNTALKWRAGDALCVQEGIDAPEIHIRSSSLSAHLIFSHLCTEYTRRSSRRRNDLVYLRDYANKRQSQRNVWRGYMCYYAIVDVTLFTLEMESSDDNVGVNLCN